PNPQGGGTLFVPPRDTTLYKGMESTLYQFKLTGEFPLYTWGKIERGIQAAMAALAAARLKEAQAMHELRYRMQGTWEALAYVVRTEAVLSLQRQAGSRLVQLARASHASGFITRSELLAAEVRAKEIDIGLAMAAEQRNRMLSELSYLSGFDNLGIEDLVLEPVPASSPRRSLAESLAEVPTENYGLAYGKALLEAQTKLQALAEIQSRGLPDLGLRLEFSYGGPRFPFIETDWYGQDDYQFTLSLGTKGNLFGNPVKAGEAVKARAQTEEARAQLAQGERNLASFLREQYLTIDLQKSRLEYAQLKLASQAEELGRQQQLVEGGSVPETEYLSKLIEHLASLADAYNQLASYRAALLRLEAAGRD
ncbi:MAG: TolC family protein, partial [Termitinemataceae bacterium]